MQSCPHSPSIPLPRPSLKCSRNVFLPCQSRLTFLPFHHSPCLFSFIGFSVILLVSPILHAHTHYPRSASKGVFQNLFSLEDRGEIVNNKLCFPATYSFSLIRCALGARHLIGEAGLPGCWSAPSSRRCSGYSKASPSSPPPTGGTGEPTPRELSGGAE